MVWMTKMGGSEGIRVSQGVLEGLGRLGFHREMEMVEKERDFFWGENKWVSQGLMRGITGRSHKIWDGRLEHLHSKCEPRIVHRDIKSENILLDENLVAKVADFGLCKFLPEDVTRIDVNHFRWLSVFINLKILIEIHFGCSYRVVLHELITGKSAIIKELTPAHLHVTNWVRAQANIKDVADLRMEGKYHMMSLDKAIKIAKKCTSLKPASRPSMSIVVITTWCVFGH
ncbi:putative LRR receptor-like serine/threonine-protein kinase [Acorus calamus]|uniref:non-specific serine/threonine protein kinase n=1 Tax=Acorus calamus TaxID=4465 RepID=A0AAV9ENC3_ACOCL|nr:putative LRR receptor-like serine/threonine-protein kinase [Acorus calamus]